MTSTTRICLLCTLAIFNLSGKTYADSTVADDAWPKPTGILAELADAYPKVFMVYDEKMKNTFNLPAENLTNFDGPAHGLAVLLSYNLRYKLYDCKFIIYLDKPKAGVNPPFGDINLEDADLNDTQGYTYPFNHMPDSQLPSQLYEINRARERPLYEHLYVGGRGSKGERFDLSAFDMSPITKYLREPIPGISVVKSSAQCGWFGPKLGTAIFMAKDWSKPFSEENEHEERIIRRDNAAVIYVPDKLSQQMLPYLKAMYPEEKF